VLLSDPRYTTQLAEECPDVEREVRRQGTSILRSVSKVAGRAKLRSLAVESQSMTMALHAAIVEALPKVELVPSDGLVEQLRMIKDRYEIASLRRAVSSAERAFAVVRAGLRGDMTERAVAHELENRIRSFGGLGCSFTPIVAVGPRAALPHARATDVRLAEHGLLLIDWGADAADGYKSDLTRVLVTGKISPKLERIYGVVLNAQVAAIKAIRPGALLKDVDAAARKVIADSGHDRHFGHGLGHGIGLQIHESPRIAANFEGQLEAGMVVTVEPGIYLPKWGGVRIEDDVLVTRDGHEVLSTIPKGLADSVIG
jgi:Xaa-Pro aminopeptidase